LSSPPPQGGRAAPSEVDGQGKSNLSTCHNPRIMSAQRPLWRALICIHVQYELGPLGSFTRAVANARIRTSWASLPPASPSTYLLLRPIYSVTARSRPLFGFACFFPFPFPFHFRHLRAANKPGINSAVKSASFLSAAAIATTVCVCISTRSAGGGGCGVRSWKHNDVGQCFRDQEQHQKQHIP
jgi:hypothetical protein